MEAAPEALLRVRFACAEAHEQATRRAAIEACQAGCATAAGSAPRWRCTTRTDLVPSVVAAHARCTFINGVSKFQGEPSDLNNDIGTA